jgi:hypothetical protein
MIHPHPTALATARNELRAMLIASIAMETEKMSQRPNFTTPAHTSTNQIPWRQCNTIEVLRRIWSVTPSKVSRQTWRWLTTEPLY